MKLKVQSVIVRKSWQEELEAAGSHHIHRKVKNKAKQSNECIHTAVHPTHFLYLFSIGFLSGPAMGRKNQGIS